VTACHLHERPGADPLRFPVIWQLRARGRNSPPATCCRATRLPATSMTSSPTWRTRTSRGTRSAPTAPRPAAAADIAAVLDAICSRRPRKDVPLGVLRDRVLFETAYVCGARASEVCGIYVEDLDLRADDEHARVHGKGGTVRTVLLDDRGYLALLRLYLARSGYTSGPLFRASINGRGGPLSYDAAHNRWKKYCAAAGTGIGIHQLRHAHATEPVGRGREPPRADGADGHSTTRAATVYLHVECIEEGGTEPTIALLRRLAAALDSDVRLTPGHDLGSVWFEPHAA
jgi:integrase